MAKKTTWRKREDASNILYLIKMSGWNVPTWRVKKTKGGRWGIRASKGNWYKGRKR